jgi:hypothetical protein
MVIKSMLYFMMFGQMKVCQMQAYMDYIFKGILSIRLSPCHLSSIPIVVEYISTKGKIIFVENLIIH